MATFSGLIDEVRNFSTRLTVDVYQDRSSQRCIPTFVTVAGTMLEEVCHKGGLVLTDQLDFTGVTCLLSNLNVLWLALFPGRQMQLDELASNIRGVGLSYHLSDLEIANWCEVLQESSDGALRLESLVIFSTIKSVQSQKCGAAVRRLGEQIGWIFLLLWTRTTGG